MTDSISTTAYETLLDVVREEFGRVAYSHKTHLKMVDRLNQRIVLEKRLNAGLLALTSGDLVGVLITESRCAKVAGLVLSALALLVTVYGLSRSRERLVELHRRTGLELWVLREDYIHLIGDLKAGAVSVDEARAIRDKLTKVAAQIYAGAPDTDGDAYEAARKALKTDEELTFSAKEIDVMLPRALRSNATRAPPSAS
ncbi:MAG: SLATT domain-containing protein [Anaeromyxobacteraceae bacterium]